MKKIKVAVIILLAMCISSTAMAVSVMGELTRTFTIKPGGKYEDTIKLRNNGKEPAIAKIYKTDLIFSSDGKSMYGQPAGQLQRSNANWIKLSQDRVEIPPNESATVYYTIEVPKEAKLRGVYWSCIMVEGIPSSSLKPITPEKGKIKMGIQSVIRYSIQIVSSTDDPDNKAKNDLKFLDKKVVDIAGKQAGKSVTKKFLTFDIENTGETSIIVAPVVDLYDEKGTAVQKFELNKLRTYPACSVRFSADLSEIKPGKYKAMIMLPTQDDDVFMAQYDFEIK